MKLMTGLLAAAVATVALAQDPAPRLPPEGKRWIESWLGTYRATDVRFTEGDREAKGTMTMTCTRAAGGWAAACKARYAAKGMPPGEDAYLVGWNVGTGQAHLFEVSSDGNVHDHVGTWSDDKTISLPYRGKNPKGEEEEDVLTFTRLTPTRTAVKAEGKAGGKTVWTLEATLVASKK